MEEGGPSVRWVELRVQGAGEGLFSSCGSGEADGPAATISGFGLPSHPSGVTKWHVGKAQVSPVLSWENHWSVSQGWSFWRGPSAVPPTPSGTWSHFTDADNWVP